MTERERFRAVLHFEQVDRVPNVEIGYWEEALVRWQKEGLPGDIPIRPPKGGDRRYTRHSGELTRYFGLDAHDVAYNVTISDLPEPSPTTEVIAQDEETKTIRWSHGLVRKCLKSNEGIFNELDWPVKCRSDWERIRKTIFPGWHRISAGSPASLPREDRDFAAMLAVPGFFWALRNLMGFEKTCMIFHEDPEMAGEMLDHFGDYYLAQCKLVLKHYEPEYVQFDEDMAYNHGPMLSPAMLEKFLLPQYEKVVSYINSEGIDVVGVDSDGFPDEMIPVLHQAGVNLWMPLEIVCRKGRDDLVTLCRRYPWLRIIGGIDKTALSRGKDAIDQELTKIAPLVERGGYIPTVDHKVPPEVSLDAYKYYVQQKAAALETKSWEHVAARTRR